jgi:hypothetical protein
MASIEQTVKALNDAHDKAEALGYGRGKGGYLEIDCPVCRGKIKCSVAGYNGHIHGRCGTPRCINRVE